MITTPPSFAYNVGMPIGSVVAFAGYVGAPVSSPPSEDNYNISPPPEGLGYTNIEGYGWMVCDGRKLYCYDYYPLFLILGFLYSQPHDDVFHVPLPKEAYFRVPDYRGYFLRMISGKGNWPSGSNPDPDTEERYLTNGTKDAGIGSIQLDAMETHQHAYYLADANFMLSDKGTPGATLTTPPPPNDQLTSSPTDNVSNPPGKIKVSDSETRSKNIYVNYLIKYA